MAELILNNQLKADGVALADLPIVMAIAVPLTRVGLPPSTTVTTILRLSLIHI